MRWTKKRGAAHPPLSPRFVAFAWRYHPCVLFAPSGRDAQPWARGVGIPVPEPDMSVETDGSPKFLGTPRVPWPCSSTPVGSVTPGQYGVPTRSPRLTRARTPTRSFRGSIAWPGHWLSTLRREGRPSTTQDSLPAAGQALPGGIGYPQGSNERFLSSSLVLLSQASWRNVAPAIGRNGTVARGNLARS